MTKLNTCEIVNQVDNKSFIIYSEWCNSHFEIMLIESTMLPLRGEMNTSDVNYFCNELGKSSDEYLQETEKIFSGKDDEVQFFIQNKILEWKKKVWTLGRIKLDTILDIQDFLKNFEQLLKCYQDVYNRINILEEENKNLINANNDLESKITKMIEDKTNMEQDFYTKFIVVLNSKKEEIRKLKDVIKKKQSTTESIFNVNTDEGEDSEEDNQTSNKNLTMNTKINKRKSLENNVKSDQKARKIDPMTFNKIFTNKMSSIEQCTTLGNKSATKKQNFSSATRVSGTNLNLEEEPEEELFSQ